jgi:2,6-dihydroxypyridine 3-monooxygenase
VVHETDLPPSTRSALDGAITYYVYANSHILVYPIPGRDGSVDPGERLVNIVWYRNYLPGDDLDDLLTDRSGVRREVSVPPGAVRPEHVDEARAHARARLPAVIADVVDGIDDLFIQVVIDVEVERMRLGRTVLVGDSAFAARPHAAAGTAKAAADGWALRDALAAHADDLDAALEEWEPGQLDLGRSLLARTRAIGRRSQFDGTWVPGDPDLIFGLYGPGD